MEELLEERLIEHDNNRKDVQNEINTVYTKALEEADSLEKKINDDIHKNFSEKEEAILSLIEKISNRSGSSDDDDGDDDDGDDDDEGELSSLVKQAQKELSHIQKYEIQPFSSESFTDSYILIVSDDNNNNNNDEKEENINTIASRLQDHLNKINEDVIAAQEKIKQICASRRSDAETMKATLNDKLETLFLTEDARIQAAVKQVRESTDAEAKAAAVLLVSQTYALSAPAPSEGSPLGGYALSVTRRPSLGHIGFGERKPSDVTVSFTDKGELSLAFRFFSESEAEVLEPLNAVFSVRISIREKGKGEGAQKSLEKPYTLSKDRIKDVCFVESLFADTVYCVKMCIEYSGLASEWSDEVEFTPPEFKTCVWKDCPESVHDERKYVIGSSSPRIATKTGRFTDHSVVIGNMTLPLNKVVSWHVKMLNYNRGGNSCVGVAQFDIDQDKCGNGNGWYFACFTSVLASGPPHNYRGKEYGPRNKNNQCYVSTGDVIGVVMDTTKGVLSFTINGVNYGVAYTGIPLDKPLAPCVLLHVKDDSVELDLSEVAEAEGNKVDNTIPAPANVTAKCEVTWDTVILKWDNVDGGASFYQIEVLDGTGSFDASTENMFTKGGLLGDTEYEFRVRAVKGSKVGAWSDAVKVRTLKCSFETSGWKECTSGVCEHMKYNLDTNNHRIATNPFGSEASTVIGNTAIPSGSVTVWGVKVLHAQENMIRWIFVGVAPSDIDQNSTQNFGKCGWYVDCYLSVLHSGPPHNYKGKKYGPKEEGEGGGTKKKRFCVGDTLNVVMDTTKGELSYVMDGVNLGTAYENIPLDKPLVPCVIIPFAFDSVEYIPVSSKKSGIQSCIIC